MKKTILLLACLFSFAVYADDKETIEKEINELTEAVSPIQQQLKELDQEFADAGPAKQSDKTYVAKMDSSFQALQTQLTETFKTFIYEHPNSPVSLQVLLSLTQYDLTIDEINSLMSALSPELFKKDQGPEIVTYINYIKQTAIGAPSPDFTMADPDGDPISISDFKDRYLLINFWASWCRYCIEDFPNLQTIYTNYKDRNFEILGISFDRPGQKRAWTEAIKKHKLPWPQMSNLQGMDTDIVHTYGIEGIPYSILLDPSGKIIAKGLRGPRLEAKLKEIFSE